MIIAITGSVGSGKTTLAKFVAQNLGARYVSLSDIAKKYKIGDVEELQTVDFNLDDVIDEVEDLIRSASEDLVLESHFAHFIAPELVNTLVVVNRDLQELKKVYIERGYNDQKMKDNLEAESFNICFYEAEEEGYEEENILVVENTDKEINTVVEEVLEKLKND